MNLPAAVPPAQITLSWILLGVLCAWMFFCAFLALRPQKTRKREMAGLPTPSGAIPAIVPRVPLRRAAASVEVSLSGVSSVSSESISDIGSPVA